MAAPHACVQCPPVQLVPADDACSGVHSPDSHSTLERQGAPIEPGTTVETTQAPLDGSHWRLLPHDQPRRQSGKHALTAAEQT
jgi:hypothetical protein